MEFGVVSKRGGVGVSPTGVEGEESIHDGVWDSGAKGCFRQTVPCLDTPPDGLV